ncbi:MAG: hypothetical protein KTR31_25450 [Myxococcales bacterium]|nr:hypothetical protein [Myxococcales bacterium]
MYASLLMVHSFLRWLVLLVLAARVLRGAQAWATGADFGGADRGLSLGSIILVDSQLLLGLGLYATSPNVQLALSDMGAAMGESVLRFWAVEHPFTMVLAVVLAHVGHAVSKRRTEQAAKHRWATLGFGLALLFIVAGIPWAFRGLGA